MNILNTFIFFLKKNPVKIILLSIFGILLYLSYKMEPIHIKIVKPIYKFTISDNAYYYTYLENSKPYTVLSQDELDKNNKLAIKEKNDDKYFCMTLISIILLLIFITSFSKDDDVNWEIKEVISNYRISNVETEMENDIYTYTYKGKLLIQTSYKLDISYIKDALKSYSDNPNLFPDYETKKQRRKRLLRDI